MSAARSPALRTLAVLAVVFGALTVFSGGRALFGGAQAQAAVGAAVGFVLWFNFCAGFAYVLAGVGLWRPQRWAAVLALLIAGGTALVALAFGVHVARGGAYETRTVGALALRLGFWALAAALARHALRRA